MKGDLGSGNLNMSEILSPLSSSPSKEKEKMRTYYPVFACLLREKCNMNEDFLVQKISVSLVFHKHVSTHPVGREELQIFLLENSLYGGRILEVSIGKRQFEKAVF